MKKNNLPLPSEVTPDDGHDMVHHIIGRAQHLEGAVLFLVEPNQHHLKVRYERQH